MKIGYQLKQVRERLAKGLVDKGILRTEKRNFLLFDMATHPVADGGAKEEIRRRVRNVLTQRTVVLTGTQWLPENLEFRYMRTIAMVCAAYAANVLENALSTLGHEARERAFAQTDELLAEYSQWPFGKKATQNGIGANLPQVIAEVSRSTRHAASSAKANPCHNSGGQQGQRQGAPARGGRCLSERFHPPGLLAVIGHVTATAQHFIIKQAHITASDREGRRYAALPTQRRPLRRGDGFHEGARIELAGRLPKARRKGEGGWTYQSKQTGMRFQDQRMTFQFTTFANGPVS